MNTGVYHSMSDNVQTVNSVGLMRDTQLSLNKISARQGELIAQDSRTGVEGWQGENLTCLDAIGFPAPGVHKNFLWLKKEVGRG